MLSVPSPSAPGPAIDWSNAYSTANLPKSGAEELARRAAAGEAVGRDRLLMTKVDKQVEQKVWHERAELRAEKGCSKESFQDLVGMAKNSLHFIQLCADEADKRAGHTNLRKSFSTAKADDKRQRGPLSALELEAWRKRPMGCDSLKTAVMLHTTELEKRLAAEKNPTGQLMLKKELQQADEAIDNMKAAEGKSQTRYMFPDSGGFVMIQSATAAFRADDDRRVARGLKPMTTGQKLARWPCLAPGWPDDMAGRMTAEEIEIRRLEGGAGKRGLQQPDAPITQKKAKKAAAAAESSSLAPRALSPSLLPVAKPPALEVPLDLAVVANEPDPQDVEDAFQLSGMFGDESAEYSAAPVDRRFAAEPARAAIATELAPDVVQAFAKGLERAPHDLSDFDPVEVAAYRKTVLLFDPKTRRPRTPTRKDLLKKGLRPVAPGAAPAAPPAASAKALGKRPMK